jgi:hypothetical protein
MALKTVLSEDQLGELDENLQQLYQQTDDGNYALAVDDIDEHPTVKSLKSGHKRSKEERDEAKKRAKEFERKFGPLAKVAEDLDLSDKDEDDLKAVAEYLKGERSDLSGADDDHGHQGKNKNDGKQPDIEKIKANARKPLEKERDEIATERDQLKQQLNNMVVDSALNSAVSEIKVHGPYTKAVKAMFRDQVKVDVDENGNPVALIDGEYGEQPVPKYLKEWAQTDEGKAFIEAPTNGGGGARGGSGSGKLKNPWTKDNWNMTEQARIYKQDPERAKRMAAEAGKKVA